MAAPELLQNALLSSVDGVVITEAGNGNERRILYVNPAFERMTGYQASAVIGKDCRFLNRRAPNQSALSVIRDSLNSASPCRVVVLNHRIDGQAFWNELSLSPVKDEQGTVTHFIGIQKDVSERVRDETETLRQKQLLSETVRQLEELVTRDGLTGLHNRRYFDQQLSLAWAMHERLDADLAVAFMDIDCYKAYNDRYGHVEGDSVLRQVSEVIARHFSRDSDICARYGGEEFVVAASLSNGIDPFLDRLASLQSSIESLGIPHEDSYAAPHVTLSIGVSHGPPPAATRPEYAVKVADDAMYEAKRAGGNTVVTRGLREAPSPR